MDGLMTRLNIAEPWPSKLLWPGTLYLLEKAYALGRKDGLDERADFHGNREPIGQFLGAPADPEAFG